MEMYPAARDFFARQGDLTQQSFVDCKENQRSMAEKDPPFGYIDMFQTWPMSHHGLRVEAKADRDGVVYFFHNRVVQLSHVLP